MPFIKKKTSIIQRDNLGLYVLAANHVARPVYGTVFDEGDEVKGHAMHVGAFMVGLPDLKPSDPSSVYEVWVVQFISAHVYKSQKITTNLRRISNDASSFLNKTPNATFADFNEFDYKQRCSFISQFDRDKHTKHNRDVAPLLRKVLRAGRVERLLANDETVA